MIETIDTRSQFDSSLPDGEREFRVEEVRRHEKGATVMYIWRLSFDGDGEREEGEQVLLPSMMGDLLRVLGCEETAPMSKKFNWDRELMPGKSFIATINHGPDKKGVERQNMTNFKKSTKDEDEIPF